MNEAAFAAIEHNLAMAETYARLCREHLRRAQEIAKNGKEIEGDTDTGKNS